MGKIKFGALVSEIRGAIGGTVFARNGSGAYARKNTAPVNPQTSAQMAVRATLGTLSNEWKSLDNQESWNEAAQDWTALNVFGDALRYSGQQLFLKLNASRRAFNPTATLLTAPPAQVTLTAGTTCVVSATFGSGNQVVTVDSNVGASGDDRYLVYASRPLSAGVTRISSAKPLALIGAIQLTAGTPVDISTMYNARFGNVDNTGSRIFVQLKKIRINTGQTLMGANGSNVVTPA